jgi:hypothetical protein
VKPLEEKNVLEAKQDKKKKAVETKQDKKKKEEAATGTVMRPPL